MNREKCMMIENVTKAVLGIMLLIQGICDYRKGKISVAVAGIFVIVGIALSIMSGDGVRVMLINALIGIVLIVISLITRGALGMGDGIVVLGIGIIAGFYMTVFILMVACILACIYALFLLVIKNKNKKSAFPFIPFLIPAYMLAICMERL